MAYAYVQSSGTALAASDTTVVLAYGSSVVAGNLLVHIIGFHSSTITITGIIDTVGTSYSQAVVEQDPGNQSVACWYGIAGGPGANTVTVTFSSTVDIRRLCIHEYSGNTASSPLDNTAHNHGALGTPPSSGAQTPSVDGCLIVGGVMETNGDVTITAGTNFTLRQNVQEASGLRTVSEDYVQSTAASVAATATFTPDQSWAAVMAIFKPSSGAVVTPQLLQRSNLRW